jgi:hypothetical protein
MRWWRITQNIDDFGYFGLMIDEVGEGLTSSIINPKSSLPP